MMKSWGASAPKRVAHQRLRDPRHGSLCMASAFSNDRRKSSPTSARYEQLAGQAARSDSSPLAAREPAGRAKAPTRGADALRASPTAKGGRPWTMLGLAVILLAIVFGLGLVLWPSNEPSVGRSTSVSTQRQSDTSRSARPSAGDKLAADSSPKSSIAVKEVPPEPPALNWEQLRARADEHAQARRWRPAAADFSAVLRDHPDDHWQWFRAATLLAWTEDQSAYRRHCAEMLQRFAEPTDPAIAERVAKACLLAPGAVADLKPVIRLADQAVAATDHQYHAYFLLARGLAHYRAGEFDKALDRASKSISGNPRLIGLEVPAPRVVARSHHRLGQADEASKALDQARDIMGQDWFPKLESGDLGEAWWHDWLICQILRREAEGLIEGKKSP